MLHIVTNNIKCTILCTHFLPGLFVLCTALYSTYMWPKHDFLSASYHRISRRFRICNKIYIWRILRQNLIFVLSRVCFCTLYRHLRCLYVGETWITKKGGHRISRRVRISNKNEVLIKKNCLFWWPHVFVTRTRILSDNPFKTENVPFSNQLNYSAKGNRISQGIRFCYHIDKKMTIAKKRFFH